MPNTFNPAIKGTSHVPNAPLKRGEQTEIKRKVDAAWQKHKILKRHPWRAVVPMTAEAAARRREYLASQRREA